MTGDSTVLLAEGLPAPLWQVVQAQLIEALATLDLETAFGTIRISADDLPGDDDAWYGMRPAASGAPAPSLTITCHRDVFCRRRPLETTVSPPPAVWDQVAAPPADAVLDPTEISAARIAAFLYHHLLTISDMRREDLVGAAVPKHLVEAFAAAWAVGVDGRLERRRLPGYPMAERRGRFSRLFSSAGILMPEHWQIFQSLWDGALTGQKDILGVARQLPRL